MKEEPLWLRCSSVFLHQSWSKCRPARSVRWMFWVVWPTVTSLKVGNPYKCLFWLRTKIGRRITLQMDQILTGFIFFSKANLLPKVCCLGQISLDCVRTRLAGVKCNNINPIAHLEEIVGGLQKDVTEIVCQGLETMQACQAKIPAEVSKMKASIHGNTDSNLGRTKLIEPLLKVAAKIAN